VSAAHTVPSPRYAPPAIAHWSDVASEQTGVPIVDGVQHAPTGVEAHEPAAQLDPTPWNAPPRLPHAEVVESAQPFSPVLDVRQQAPCAGCGQGWEAHVVPSPS
jgi:hypothetical protein